MGGAGEPRNPYKEVRKEPRLRRKGGFNNE